MSFQRWFCWARLLPRCILDLTCYPPLQGGRERDFYRLEHSEGHCFPLTDKEHWPLKLVPLPAANNLSSQSRRWCFASVSLSSVFLCSCEMEFKRRLLTATLERMLYWLISYGPAWFNTITRVNTFKSINIYTYYKIIYFVILLYKMK